MSSCAPLRVTRSAATQLQHGLVLVVLTTILRAASCSWSRIPTTTRPRALNARTLNTQRCAIQTMDPALVAVAICRFMAAAIQAHPTQPFPPLTRTRWDEAPPHSLALKTSRPRTTRCGLSRDAAHAGGQRGRGGGVHDSGACISRTPTPPPQRLRCSKNNNRGLQSAQNKLPLHRLQHTLPGTLNRKKNNCGTVPAVRHVQHVIWGVGGNDEREAR